MLNLTSVPDTNAPMAPRSSARGLLSELGSSASNLFIAAAGAGLLSYPFAVMQQGMLVCILLTLLFAWLTVKTDFVLVQTAHLFRRAMRRGTFEELSLVAFGTRMYALSAASVLIGCLGAMIGFMIVIGDLLVPVAEHLCNCSGDCSGSGSGSGSGGGVSTACAVMTSRAMLVMLCAVCVALPLSSFRKIHSLGASSVLAAVTVIAVGILVVVKGSGALSGDEEPGTSTERPTGVTSLDEPIILARFNFIGCVLGIPISIFSLGNHCQVVPVFLEMRPEAQRRFGSVVTTAVSACVVLYLLTGVFGYLAFRDGTKGDVLLNFSVTDPAADVAKALLAIHIVLAYPVLLYPCREAIALLLSLRQGRSSSSGESSSSDTDALLGADYKDRSKDSSPSSSGSGISGALWRIATSNIAQSAVLVLFTSGISILFPQVAVVFGLVGASISTWQIYGIPGLLLLRWSAARSGSLKLSGSGGGSEEEGGGGRGFDAALQREAADTWSTVASDGSGRYGFSSHTDDGVESADREDAGVGEGEGEGAGECLALLPLSPRVLRLQGYLMCAIGVLIGVIGTGTYIYSTWISP